MASDDHQSRSRVSPARLERSRSLGLYSNTIAGVALSDCSAFRRSHTFAAMSR
jgi:hypothetical protein